MLLGIAALLLAGSAAARAADGRRACVSDNGALGMDYAGPRAGDRALRAAQRPAGMSGRQP